MSWFMMNHIICMFGNPTFPFFVIYMVFRKENVLGILHGNSTLHFCALSVKTIHKRRISDTLLEHLAR